MLRKVIASARAEEVPKATIESAIKRATTTAELQELIYEMLGPGKRSSSNQAIDVISFSIS